MARRAYVLEIHIGENRLPAESAHHVRNVLRMQVGDLLELFTQNGTTAMATLATLDEGAVFAVVDSIRPSTPQGRVITVATALPKGDRAEWMVEKLSELGVVRFIPLAAERSVVLPSGQNKLERWRRIAVEASRQCGRDDVMAIEPLAPVPEVLSGLRSADGVAVHLSTAVDAPPLVSHAAVSQMVPVTLFVGPEGGWTTGEIARFDSAGASGVGLTRTVLRIETAAVSAAAVLACRASS